MAITREFTKLSFMPFRTVLLFTLILPLVVAASDGSELPKTMVFAKQVSASNSTTISKDVALLRRISDELQTQIEYFECPWARCLRAITNGDADIISDLYFSEERNQTFHYLIPHYQSLSSSFRFYALAERSLRLENLQELSNYSVAVVRGNVYFDEFDQNESIVKVAATDIIQAINMVEKGRVDLLIAPQTLLEQTINELSSKPATLTTVLTHCTERKKYFALSRQSQWFPFKDQLEALLKELGPIETEHLNRDCSGRIAL